MSSISLISSETLQVLGHDNIFALGDVVDLPIQNSNMANMHQIRCITENAINYLEAKTLTGKYKLQSELNLYTGIAKLNSFSSESGNDKIGNENDVLQTLTYYLKCKFGSGGMLKMYNGKSNGIGKLYGMQNKFEKAESTGSEPKFVMEH